MAARVEALTRSWAEFIGPEASRVNNAVAVSFGIVGLIFARRSAQRAGAGGVCQAAIGVLALDLFGGAYVNNTRACVRWYERAGQGTREHLTFAASHVHPLVVGVADERIGRRNNGVVYSSAHYGYMMLATAVIRRCPSQRRPLGLVLAAGGLLLDRALGRSAVAPWFASIYYPKLLTGHAAGSLWPDEDLGVEELDPRA